VEYNEKGLVDRISLFDVVNVEFPALGVSTTAKVNKIVYDVLLDRIEKVTIGNKKENIADTIAPLSPVIQLGKYKAKNT
jgi:phage-related protein